ncbi:hypothetical protein [Agaribacterium haliotis]|uniref:hypothetical protein n=1 Tax=Agaribacterium haliotis TaxID=2013869 RepID=UPI00117866EF|nr:hypothetical protein [Agaribacterium haliotis]
MKLLWRAFLILSVFCFSSAAYANYYCTGKVSYLGTDGSLWLSNGFGVHKLCVLEEEYCKVWVSIGLAAKMADKSVSVYYQGGSGAGNQNAGLCKSIGSWVNPSDKPYHFQIH